MPDPAPRTRGERLATIGGRWRTSGHVIGEPKLSVLGTDMYEVFSGSHFLVHHVDVAVGGQPVRAIEVIGEPDGRGGYLARSFDSEGTAELMHLTVDNDGVCASPAAATSRLPPNRRNTDCARPVHTHYRPRP